MFEQTITMDDGSKVLVKIGKSKCGRGIVISQQIHPVGKAPLSMQCSGSCGGGPTISWSCPDGKDCFLDCTGDSAKGSCY
jgi:hypothetical protein